MKKRSSSERKKLLHKEVENFSVNNVRVYVLPCLSPKDTSMEFICSLHVEQEEKEADNIGNIEELGEKEEMNMKTRVVRDFTKLTSSYESTT